jgi:hypothetical protein
MPTVTKYPLRSEVRCLDLWNGSTNNATPTNWRDPSFDDSAWSFSATPSVGASLLRFHCTGDGATSALAAGAQALWPTTTPRNTNQYAIFRWHLTLPAPGSYTVLDVNWWTASPCDFFGGTLCINGTATPISDNSILPAATTDGAFQINTVAGDNVLSWMIAANHYNESVGGIGDGLNWGTTAWTAWKFVIDIQGGGRSWGQVIG